MSAAVETLDISPVGRVEGDLDVRVDIENGFDPNYEVSPDKKTNRRRIKKISQGSRNCLVGN